MEKKFSIELLEEAVEFIENLDDKPKSKIIYNLNLASRSKNSNLFKKLNEDIWEFRTLYNKQHYRLFAFWDKSDKEETLVICSHGIIKKMSKVPQKSINKAESIRNKYFEAKNKIK